MKENFQRKNLLAARENIGVNGETERMLLREDAKARSVFISVRPLKLIISCHIVKIT